MNIFYTTHVHPQEEHFELSGQESQHAVKVLRVKEGDEIHATDGKGFLYTGNIESISKNKISAKITDTELCEKESPDIVLAMGIIKKRDRLEFAVEKAVELGASEIILFKSDHSEKSNVRVDRLQSIAISAMKQSKRSYLPHIRVLDSLSVLLNTYNDAVCLLAHEEKGYRSKIADDLNHFKEEKSKVVLIVGPEGGFSDIELELSRQNNINMISLGKYRLRAETAAVAFLSRFL